MARAQTGVKPKRAIVLSGGGARGAYEAGALRFILDDLPRRTGLPVQFDIITGTSVGAINACFLAATADQPDSARGERLVNLWGALHVEEIFRFTARDALELPGKIFNTRRMAEQLRAGQRPDRLFGLLDTRPLEKLVRTEIAWNQIRRNLREGRVEAVCVAATQLATGRAVVFVERKDRTLPPWADQANLRMQAIRLLPVHALASAAIPMLFPAVRVGGRYYADGGLRLNTPLAPAVRLGANRILVIGLSRLVPGQLNESVVQDRVAGFGNPMYLFGKVLNALLLSPIEADLARMHVINRFIDYGTEVYGEDFLTRMNQVAEAQDDGRHIQKVRDLIIRPSRDLGMIAGEVLDSGELELSPFLRVFMRAFGSGQPNEADLLSYLLFDGSYARALAELGYQDAMAREDEIVAFFSEEAAE